ncbi:MAG TPA: hypothetical protein VNY31_03100 [Solirubrobacteraceae bacterium]|jgi:hypothetical protein|nr:hypothetical protein [Solirubrobacteraceae bacterium]
MAPESPLSKELRVGDPLPYPDRAIVEDRKLRDYALDTDHDNGGPKARLFYSILHIGREDWAYLRDEILRTLPDGCVREVKPNPYTTTYGVVLPIRGLNGRVVPVITAWKLHGGVPRLVSVRVDIQAIPE